MEQHNVAKKKKRRTRKCLDELRRRSRRLKYNENFGLGNKLHGVEEPQTLNNLVTMNRLTLNMFPKAIRSETITRPVLEEVQREKSYNMDSNKNIINIPNRSLVGPATHFFDPCNSAASDNSMPFFRLDDNVVEDNLSNQSDLQLSNYRNFKSSRNQQQNLHVNEATIHSMATRSSSSSQTLDNGEESNFYEKFMDEISSYLDSVTPALFKENTLRQTKVKFLNLIQVYNKIQSQASDYKFIDDGGYNELKDSIVQNPLDYLRLKHAEEEETLTKCHMTLTQHSSSTQPKSADSHYILDKECTALYETPEYKYYPHRLN